jgi:hypothetical protein
MWRWMLVRPLRLLTCARAQVQPQWLFISSWNEMIAQPQAGADVFGGAMGLSADPTLGSSGFVGELERAASGNLEAA